jgi:multiple sugar transport system ATP-binding protein
MAALVLKNLMKHFKGGAVGVHNLTIEVREGEFMVLVGPSGCGKSTTLRLVAGLEAPTSGEVFIGGTLANDIPPRDRDIAMVFQDYALYPHLNVEQNLGFGLKVRGMPRREVRSRVAETSRMLGIVDLLDRKPRQLSGGQRQRVALGRALVRNPRLFLFDEPLSNLDASLRVQLRQEIREIHRKVGATMLYVTHDQDEAMSLGQRIAVMNGGSLEQVGSPRDIYCEPATRFVAGFFGNPSMNFVECTARSGVDALEVAYGKTNLAFRLAEENRDDGISQQVLLGFRPEDVRLDAAAGEGSLSGAACVLSVEVMVAEALVSLETEASRPVARLLGFADLKAGDEVAYSVERNKLHLFDAVTGRRIAVE